jgi:hypothetical protein
MVGRLVVARSRIEDNPLAEMDSSANSGDTGLCEDYSECDGLIYVDFGRGAIACYPNEVMIK